MSPTIFRKLSAENRKLFTTVEKESSEKKRLSMENEELHWKIRQSMDHSYGANTSGLLSMSVIEGIVFCPYSHIHCLYSSFERCSKFTMFWDLSLHLFSKDVLQVAGCL